MNSLKYSNFVNLSLKRIRIYHLDIWVRLNNHQKACFNLRVNYNNFPKNTTNYFPEITKERVFEALHFMINIFDTKYDIYGFVEATITSKSHKQETRERIRQKANWISFRAALLFGLMIVLKNGTIPYRN